MEEDVDMFDLMDDGLNEFLVERANRLALEKKPLFKANMVFLPYQRQGLKGAVKFEQEVLENSTLLLEKSRRLEARWCGYTGHIRGIRFFF